MQELTPKTRIIIRLIFDLVEVFLSKLELYNSAEDYHQLWKREKILQGIMDSISFSIAVIDENGFIIAVNEAWLNFARNNHSPKINWIGMNYLSVCETAKGPYSQEADPMARGLRELLAGQKEEIVMEYPCHSPQQNRWFIARATPLYVNGELKGAVIAHTDITERKEAEEKLADYTMEMEVKTMEIEYLYARIEEEINKTVQIHERNLPHKFPEVEGVSISAYYQTAERLGGDFYNVIKKENKLIFYLSDVTGHGMEGTLVSAFVKEAIDSYISLRPENIGAENIIQYLTQKYQKQNYPEDYFISFFLGILDLDSMELEYAGAGFQESFLLKRSNHEDLTLYTQGLPISAVIPPEMFTFQSQKVSLDAGSTILINTDGLTEQTVNEENYSQRRDNTFWKHSNLPPEVLINEITEDFYNFNQGEYQGDDDITIMIIQLAPEDQLNHYWELQSTFSELERLNDEIYRVFSQHITEDFLFMGIHELVTNAIEHGNREHPDRKVYINFTITSNYFLATIEDEGKGFNWKDRKHQPLAAENLKDRGRGISIAQKLADKIFYNNKGNKAYYFISLENPM